MHDEYGAPADHLSAAAREAIARHAREQAAAEALAQARAADGDRDDGAEAALADMDPEEAAEHAARLRDERLAREAERIASTPDPDQPQPDVLESLRQLRDAGRAGMGAAGEAAKALRTLVSADFSLARSAFGRTLAFTGMAIAFGATGWLLLMGALIVFLSLGMGMPWSGSLLLTALLSIAITWYAGWQAMRYFDHTRMQATRRQLARLGIGELADFTPRPGDVRSAREATEDPNIKGDPPRKDGLGVDLTPP